jgi:hypothetical protein
LSIESLIVLLHRYLICWAGRVAMLAMLGFFAQTSTGTTPLANLAAHLSDPWHINVSVNAEAIPFL